MDPEVGGHLLGRHARTAVPRDPHGVLAAVHAARVARIAVLMLDDVDVGNRRLTIAGRARPLDGLTPELMVEWPDYRRRRWPSTANLHLLIDNQTANTTSRASNHWVSAPMRGQDATLERLRSE
ncbi:hypothetical protein [Streptomyces omiyaensis]|uniref:Transposase n=1 Tax=Streptomyces omiyaensis TaxID=68247 RepID=A0ABW7BMJ0_9ACTN|nr:hypothetical protein [Streptomyces omiyaensis]GGY60042.1 hypothetical protein GCM10010363_46930 [Streptomyces omiyaensis]